MSNNLKSLFDESIKRSFCNGEPVMPGIFAKENFCYGRNIKGNFQDTYFSKEYGEKLVSSLDDNIIRLYKNGKGNEIDTGKFFCVASSSRFTVASFSEYRNGKICIADKIGDLEIEDPSFEYGLDIQGIKGTPPQIDFHCFTNFENFVEVKCHEIFDYHNSIKLSTQYSNNDIFNKICKKYGISDNDKVIKVDSKTNTEKEVYDIKKTMLNIKCRHSHFDLKQFICHIMGIISNTKKEDHKNFIYLFYKSDDTQFKKVYEELENEIGQVEKSFDWLLKEYNIHFHHIYNSQFNTLQSFI